MHGLLRLLPSCKRGPALPADFPQKRYSVCCASTTDNDSETDKAGVNDGKFPKLGITPPVGLSDSPAQSTKQAALEPCPDLFSELAAGELWAQCLSLCKSYQVPWGPKQLAKVMASGAALLPILGAAATQLPPTGAGDSLGFVAQSAASDPFSRIFLQELLCCLLVSGVLIVNLRECKPTQKGFFRLYWDAALARQVVLLCAFVFPLVDPLVYNLWSPMVSNLTGWVPDGQAVQNLQAAVASGDVLALAKSFPASTLFGPFWEEVFWRGFFLASLTKVVPLPAAVAVSSLNFAALHTSAHNFLPLLLLSFCCDVLYLRTRNLAGPLLFHSLWNAYQLTAICLGKASFV